MKKRQPEAPSEDKFGYSLSEKARADLKAGLESAQREPLVHLGSFAQYADDE